MMLILQVTESQLRAMLEIAMLHWLQLWTDAFNQLTSCKYLV